MLRDPCSGYLGHWTIALEGVSGVGGHRSLLPLYPGRDSHQNIYFRIHPSSNILNLAVLQWPTLSFQEPSPSHDEVEDEIEMVQLRSGKYLSCFYCGKRSDVRKDGLTKSFDCEYCEATNYLDKVRSSSTPFINPHFMRN